MRPVLPKAFQALCNKDMPITDNLFGDDLHKVKEISDAKKVFGNFSGPNNSNRGRYGQQRGRYYYAGAQTGQGQGRF